MANFNKAKTTFPFAAACYKIIEFIIYIVSPQFFSDIVPVSPVSERDGEHLQKEVAESLLVPSFFPALSNYGLFCKQTWETF